MAGAVTLDPPHVVLRENGDAVPLRFLTDEHGE